MSVWDCWVGLTVTSMCVQLFVHVLLTWNVFLVMAQYNVFWLQFKPKKFSYSLE